MPPYVRCNASLELCLATHMWDGSGELTESWTWNGSSFAPAAPQNFRAVSADVRGLPAGSERIRDDPRASRPASPRTGSP